MKTAARNTELRGGLGSLQQAPAVVIEDMADEKRRVAMSELLLLFMRETSAASLQGASPEGGRSVAEADERAGPLEALPCPPMCKCPVLLTTDAVLF